MTYYYLDTSAVVKRYMPETGSYWIVHLVDPFADTTIFLAEITLAETAAAFAARRRASDGITRQERDTALNLFLQHCRGEYDLIPVTRAILHRAVLLTQGYRLRGYDAVQLATALATNDVLVGAGRSKMVFVSADEDLLRAAQDEGMATDNPNRQGNQN